MKKIIITIIIAVLIMPYIATISYAEDALETGGGSPYNWVLPEQQRAVALYTQKFVKEGNERNILLYSQNRLDRIKGYNLEVTSNEYGQFDGKQNNGAPFTNMLVYDSASFVATMYHRTLGMDLSANSNARDNIYTVESFIKDAENKNPFIDYTQMADNNFGFINGEEEYSYQELIQMADSGQMRPGDLIIYDDETHIMMYLGSGDEIIYDELIIEEAIVEDQSDDGAGVDGMDDEGVAEGPKMTVQVGRDAHYFAHSYDASTNVRVSALELLAYLEDPDSEYYVIRPKATPANKITTEKKVLMDIVWPDSSYSAYTKLGTDPVTGKNQEYYYVGIPTIEEYFARDDVNGTKYVFVGTDDSGQATYKETRDYSWLIHEVGEVVSWFTGYVGLLSRSWLVGWISQIEEIVSDTIQAVGKVQRETIVDVEGNAYAITKDDTINIEDVIYNRVPLFDANIFNSQTIAGKNVSTDILTFDELMELRQRAELKGEDGIKAQKELEDYYSTIRTVMAELELKDIEVEDFLEDEKAMEKLENYRYQANPILVIRQNVANMYLIIRNIAIVGLLITLIYIGVRMAITTIAEQKAKYKKILVNWCISLLIVFMIHYIMVFILQLNDALIKMLPDLTGGVTFYETFREMAYEIKFVEGWIGAIAYAVLLVFMMKYIWIYIKRFFTLCVLTVAAPIIGIGYAVDKIKDNKSQSLSRWVRNYTFNVIIQFIHAALYTVFMSIVYALLGEGQTFPAAILAVVFLNFMTQAVKIIQNIFRVDANTLKNTLEDFGTQMAGMATIFGLVKTQSKLYGMALRPVKAAGGAVMDAVKYKHNDIKWGHEFDYLGDNEAIRQRVQEEEEVREKLEKQRKEKIKQDKARRRAASQAQMQYAKNIMNMSKGLAYAAAAIPTTIISPKAGIAMLLTARNTYSKAQSEIKEQQSKILGYDVDSFKGRFSMARVVIGAVGGNGIIGMVETAKEQIRVEKKLHRENVLKREEMNEVTEMANLLRYDLEVQLEKKYNLQLNGQYDAKEIARINTRIEIMRTMITNITKGKDPFDVDIKNGVLQVILPETLIREAIAKYQEEREAKGLSTFLGGKHIKEIIQYISEYADVKILSESKLDDIELILKADILKGVLRKISCSSYREGEENRDKRHRDPRKSSSLLKDNDITEKKIYNEIQKRVDIRNIDKVDQDDISKMAAELFREIENNDSLTDEQKKDIINAIEGNIEEKVAKMKVEKELAQITENEHLQEKRRNINIKISKEKQKEIEDAIKGYLKDNTEESRKILKDKLNSILTKDEVQKILDGIAIEELIHLIVGKTKIEIPQDIMGVAQSSERLRKIRHELQLNENRTKPADNDIDGLLDLVKRHKF